MSMSISNFYCCTKKNINKKSNALIFNYLENMMMFPLKKYIFFLFRPLSTIKLIHLKFSLLTGNVNFHQINPCLSTLHMNTVIYEIIYTSFQQFISTLNREKKEEKKRSSEHFEFFKNT